MEDGKILLTGASGFLGQALLASLIKSGQRISCVGRRRPDYNDDLCDWRMMDFERGVSDDIMAGVSTVIHLAASLGDHSRRNMEKINVETTRDLLEAARRAGIKKFIYISSIAAKNGQSVYATTKRSAEEMVKKSGLNYVILRPTLIFSSLSDKLISKLIFLVRFGIVPIIGNGQNKFQPIFRDDLVGLIKIILGKGLTNKIYEVGGSEILTFDELILAVAAVMKKRVLLLHFPKIIFYPLHYLHLLPPLFNFVDFNLDKLANNLPIYNDFGFVPTGSRKILLKPDN